MYDYYEYPQLYESNYGQDDHANANAIVNADDGDKTETTNSDDIEEFIVTRKKAETKKKHMTYVNNGAVISNVQPTQEIPQDALIIENTDYDDQEWVDQGVVPPNGVSLVIVLLFSCTKCSVVDATKWGITLHSPG